MILDLDGATSEPSRRRHVAALSTATAVLSIVLFYVLVAPATLVSAPQAASPSPTPIGMTVVSNPLINMPVEIRSALCAEAAPLDESARPTPMTWASFRLSVDATRGPAFPVVIYDQTGSRPVAFVSVEQGTGGFIVTCATSDRSAPRNRAP